MPPIGANSVAEFKRFLPGENPICPRTANRHQNEAMRTGKWLPMYEQDEKALYECEDWLRYIGLVDDYGWGNPSAKYFPFFPSCFKIGFCAYSSMIRCTRPTWRLYPPETKRRPSLYLEGCLFFACVTISTSSPLLVDTLRHGNIT